MVAKTPEDRALVARIAAAERWAHTRDRTAATEPWRQGLRAKFAREVDPDGTMSPDDLARAIEAKMRAHMLRMTFAAKQARAARKAAAAKAAT